MKTYSVYWSINVEAEDPRDAAEQARELAIAPDTTATLYEVVEHSSDEDLAIYRALTKAVGVDLGEADREEDERFQDICRMVGCDPSSVKDPRAYLRGWDQANERLMAARRVR